ncbi:MAG: S8 family serine peptidase [Bacteroidia bacterium]
MRLILLILIPVCLFSQPVSAQENGWIFLKDKNLNDIPVLSPHALSNRMNQGIAPDFYDLPVNKVYVQTLKNSGISILATSRWLNAVFATMTPDQWIWAQKQAFVQSVRPGSTLHTYVSDLSPVFPPQSNRYAPQLQMLGLEQMHGNGFTGQGVIIAVFDNGFANVDSLEGFAHIFRENRLLATRDFVDGDVDVFEPCSQCRHGTQVLSVLAANMPGQLIGAAPDASYILIRTENSYEETKAEEALFITAAEWADSLGAQIFNLSYGYRYFDPGEGDYLLGDLDGNTSLITRAADIAASRGILVVTSAGNYGKDGIQAPADGDSVLAIGGVDENRNLYASSSRGPTADGRIKPDLTAMGEGVRTLIYSGELRNSNGTSFASPLVAGLAATIIQAQPQTNWTQRRDALLKSADRYAAPDNNFGYGIPFGPEALRQLGFTKTKSVPFAEDPFGQNDFFVFPNPSNHSFTLIQNPENIGFEAVIRVTDISGRVVFRDEWTFGNMHLQYNLTLESGPGIYYILILEKENNTRKFAGKLVFLPD